MNTAVAQTEFFTCGGIKLAAKRWGTAGGVPVIALHGWLDNCASFDRLANELGPSVELIALDLAGHGLSDYRSHLGAYNIWQDVVDVLAVADQLNWKSFHLMGHSRGAMAAFLTAGTMPTRVRSLAMLEGICPKVAESNEAPEVLAASVAYLLAFQKRKTHYYSTMEEAIQARVNGFIPVQIDVASALAERGVERDQRGYFWRYDPKLLIGSEVRFNLEQVNAFARRLPKNKLLVTGDKGLVVTEPAIMQWLPSIADLNILSLEGDHYVHTGEGLGQIVPKLLDMYSV